MGESTPTPLFALPADGHTPLRAVKMTRNHPRSPTSCSPFRSPVVQTKVSGRQHDLVLEFRSSLSRPSRWKQTEAVMHLLEKLASEDGFYKNEMQQVVGQLQKDLFVEIGSLPEFIQKRVESGHLEAFLTRRVPYHVFTSELLAYIHQLEFDTDSLVKDAHDRIASCQQASQRLSEERESLEQQLQAYHAQPHLDATMVDQLRSEIVTLRGELKTAAERIARLKKKKVGLRMMLKRRDEVLIDLMEAKKTLTAQAEELSQAQVQRDIQLKRMKEQSKVMESRCVEAIAQMKSALVRIVGLEQQLSQSQNECIALKERAAVAFDELTPRPDWLAAGIVQVEPDRRKSSKDCVFELLKIAQTRRSPSRRKTRKVLSPPPD